MMRRRFPRRRRRNGLDEGNDPRYAAVARWLAPNPRYEPDPEHMNRLLEQLLELLPEPAGTESPLPPATVTVVTDGSVVKINDVVEPDPDQAREAAAQIAALAAEEEAPRG